MWTDTTRAQYARANLALPSDLTDGEWGFLEPFFFRRPRILGVRVIGCSGGLWRLS